MTLVILVENLTSIIGQLINHARFFPFHLGLMFISLSTVVVRVVAGVVDVGASSINSRILVHVRKSEFSKRLSKVMPDHRFTTHSTVIGRFVTIWFISTINVTILHVMLITIVI